MCCEGASDKSETEEGGCARVGRRREPARLPKKEKKEDRCSHALYIIYVYVHMYMHAYMYTLYVNVFVYICMNVYMHQYIPICYAWM